MTPEQAKKTRLNTDYPLDKVVWMYESSVTLAAFDIVDVTIPHGLGFIPLPKGMWTNQSNWATSYDFNSGPIITNPSIPAYFTFQVVVESNPTNVILRTRSYVNTTTTLYYRIYCFMPSGVSALAPNTNTGGNRFIMNTDYNYTKLFMSGQTPTSSTPNSTYTLTHGLGYRPQVISWPQSGNTVYDANFPMIWGGTISDRGVDVGLDTITFKRSSVIPSSESYHYRIYLDE